ncbi:hypothetical protein SDRG_01484 [Saprolegnia diclina VS20]|uniref:Uncharacterized protein n=1 Tax=Saprolegnia diclina (strain VS20) TaxID=1156394 RepID=T0QTN5_SAPDV|nr:hypothetical protein SDRG_01484 [Saprolegnia diclina VS20]EQC41519.1 hypothetical protein SDRG_01484 [Saprolegnia diclina VS20]|eukprot:XP_008605233.1 hypothetical protein SDRG_01484 [Saprolegnia diclina VS20]
MKGRSVAWTLVRPSHRKLALAAFAACAFTLHTIAFSGVPQRPLLRSKGEVLWPKALYTRMASVRNETQGDDLFGDIVHLNNLNEACFHANDSIVHWAFNSSEVNHTELWTRDATPRDELIAHLAQCPEVDVFLPAGLRDHGYCEDGMAYVKFLKTRALPIWVFDLRFDYEGRTNINYFDLCPNTALLFMNHYRQA